MSFWKMVQRCGGSNEYSQLARLSWRVGHCHRFRSRSGSNCTSDSRSGVTFQSNACSTARSASDERLNLREHVPCRRFTVSSPSAVGTSPIPNVNGQQAACADRDGIGSRRCAEGHDFVTLNRLTCVTVRNDASRRRGPSRTSGSARSGRPSLDQKIRQQREAAMVHEMRCVSIAPYCGRAASPLRRM